MRTEKKNIALKVFAALLLPFLAASLLIPNTSAAEQDVYITVKDLSRERRYAVDILFRNTAYYYDLESMAENVLTGERYINSGKWRESVGAEAQSFTLTVRNRANYPVVTECAVQADDFVSCGAGVTVRGGERTLLPAVKEDSAGAVAYDRITDVIFGAYPNPDAYRGVKRVFATVTVRPGD